MFKSTVDEWLEMVVTDKNVKPPSPWRVQVTFASTIGSRLLGTSTGVISPSALRDICLCTVAETSALWAESLCDFFFFFWTPSRDSSPSWRADRDRTNLIYIKVTADGFKVWSSHIQTWTSGIKTGQVTVNVTVTNVMLCDRRYYTTTKDQSSLTSCYPSFILLNTGVDWYGCCCRDATSLRILVEILRLIQLYNTCIISRFFVTWTSIYCLR